MKIVVKLFFCALGARCGESLVAAEGCAEVNPSFRPMLEQSGCQLALCL